MKTNEKIIQLIKMPDTSASDRKYKLLGLSNLGATYCIDDTDRKWSREYPNVIENKDTLKSSALIEQLEKDRDCTWERFQREVTLNGAMKKGNLKMERKVEQLEKENTQLKSNSLQLKKENEELKGIIKTLYKLDADGDVVFDTFDTIEYMQDEIIQAIVRSKKNHE